MGQYDTMDYEYDTGRPILSTTPIKDVPLTNDVTIVSIKDNPDGSANIVIDMSPEVRDALLRKALVQTLVNAAKEAQDLNVKDEQPRVSECGWVDESIKCQRCNCWKNG